ncbi:MAG TPA: alpha-amylase family glycosyl hydrolase [Acidimicrobiales bacterium]|nr:alpha-amylase family glycosyl hydrolase [Acidimicrobiales bacterium]
MTAPWWKTAVLYQIYPRSFRDSDGDGVGDLEGIRSQLPYLRRLGVDGVWLSPIYASPMADFGYDVSDHCDVHPLFGGLPAFDRLLAGAHDQGLKVMLDWVPNHTSDRHPWFVDSRSSRTSPRRNWYVWRDGREGQPPNNWVAAFGGRAWTFDDATGQWYLHLFLPEQPDLDWGEPGVEAAMHGVLRFWLDRGVDGFRADVVHLIGKDPDLADLPPGVHLAKVNTHESAHPRLRGIRAVLDSYPGDRAMVGEVNLASADLLAPYYGDGDELHLVFNFTLLRAPWDAAHWAERIAESEAALLPVGGWPVYVLSNHDEVRHRSRYGGAEDRARVAAAVLLTLRCTPFLYAGEELGLEDAVVPDEARVDPGGRDGCRAPVPWDTEPGHGWAGDPWLPWPPDAGARSAAAQEDDSASILHLYRRLLAARRASPALHAGAYEPLDAPAGVLAYERRAGDDRRRVWANFGAEAVGCEGGWVVEVSTTGEGEGAAWDGRLGPVEAVVVRPGTVGRQ